MTSKTIRGVARGSTIELESHPGLEDGREVEVMVRVIEPPRSWGAGIFASAGCMADDPEFDAVMEEVQGCRKSARF